MTMQLIPEDQIQKVADLERESRRRELAAREASLRDSWRGKELWLSVFARSLSVAIACRQADVSMTRYRRWRKTDAAFCRAINRVLEGAHEELIGSAYVRATGYFKPDPGTATGYEEDATGRPIRYGGSDRLALELLDKNQKQIESQTVIHLDFSKLKISDPNILTNRLVTLTEPRSTSDEESLVSGFNTSVLAKPLGIAD